MSHEPKLTVLLPLKVSEDMARKLTRRAGTRRKRPEFIRLTLAEALKRSKRTAPLVTSREARAVIETRRCGLDPVQELIAAMARASGVASLSTVAAQVAPITTGKLQLARA